MGSIYQPPLLTTNPGSGSGTLNNGSATVSLPSLTSGQTVLIVPKGGGVLANIGILRVTLNPGTGFTVTSTNALDNSQFDFRVVN